MLISKELLKVQTDQHILHFLMKIDEKFEHVRSNILMMPVLPVVSQVYRILQQETHKQISKHNQIEPTTFFSSKRQAQEKESNTNANSYISKGYPRQIKYQNNGTRRTLFCDHCKNTGHAITKCYKLHGYPNQIKGKRSTAFACTDDEAQVPTRMSQEQFSRLLSLMAQQKEGSTQETIVHHAELASSSNFAGISFMHTNKVT